MKRKLQFLSVVALTILLGAQTTNAQTGGNFQNGVARATPYGPGELIEFEDFDLGANANLTVNPTGVAPFGYSDNSAGVASGSTYRVTDVDIVINSAAQTAPTGNGLEIGGMTATEYAYYTIQIATSGSYRLDVTHRVSSAKNLSVALLNPADLTAINTPVVTSMPSTLGVYATNPTSAFDICAGTYVLKIAFTGGAGPVYDSFTVSYVGALVGTCNLGVNKLDAKSEFKVYPSSSKDGRFNLSDSTKWEVYSISGAKVKQGEGELIDISSAAKGVYILKTDSVTKKIIFE
jgi:hypothetical protein